jgi:hypothetical protein
LRRRRGETIAWHGTVPPQKWMNFSTEMLSRFASAPGLKLEVSFEVPPGEGTPEARREEVRAALRELGLAEDLGTHKRSPVVRDVTQPPCPALLNLPTGSTLGGTARLQGRGGVARTGPGCRRGRRGKGESRPEHDRISRNCLRRSAHWRLAVWDVTRLPPAPSDCHG